MSGYDVAVVGGGPAGLQAALLLGRGGTRVIVYDSGTARHLVAAESHSFLGADGMPPAKLRRRGREQLAPYATVKFRNAFVEDIERAKEGGAAAGAVHASQHLPIRDGVAVRGWTASPSAENSPTSPAARQRRATSVTADDSAKAERSRNRSEATREASDGAGVSAPPPS